MCTLYQIIYALTSFGQCLILGHRTHVRCAGMPITHRHRLQIEDTVINIDNYLLIKYVNL